MIKLIFTLGLLAFAMTASTDTRAQSWAGYVMIHKMYPRNYAEPCWSAAVSRCARERRAAQARAAQPAQRKQAVR